MFLLEEDRHENIKVKKFETKEVNKESKKRKNWKQKQEDRRSAGAYWLS